MTAENEQFNIWEPSDDPRLMMRCTICGEVKEITIAPLPYDDFHAVALFMQQHEDCFYSQQPKESQGC